MIFFQLGESATYNCTKGYRIAGENDNSVTSAQLDCGGNSSAADWSEERPVCERKKVFLL